jgi:hypothetical protein
MRIRPLVFGLGLLFASPQLAHAGGLELLPGGTRSLMRGGAVGARPIDSMTLIQNPAGLALLPDNQFLIEFDVPFKTMCADLYGYYGWGLYNTGNSDAGDSRDPDYAALPLEEVCNSAPTFAVPQLVWSVKVGKNLGIGFGFAAPTVVGGLHYGGEDGTVAGPDGWALPTPTRYQLIRQEVVFGLNPTFGFGYRLLRELAVGMTLQVGMAKADTWNVQAYAAGTSPHLDQGVKVRAEDLFIPAVTLSVHAKPVKGLDVMAAMRMVSDLNGSGKLTYTTNYYQNADAPDGAPVPYKNPPIGVANIRVGFPWMLTLGARYGHKLPGIKDDDDGDPMDTERWDIEADLNVGFNERGSLNEVTVNEDVVIDFRVADGTPQLPLTVSADSLDQFSFDRHLQNSVVGRLGGSYSLVPRLWALHGGLFVESRGVDPAYAHIDSFAFRRVGMGLGTVVRLGSFDLMVAYGHIFQETLEVAPPAIDDPSQGFDQRVNGVVTPDPDAPAPKDADAVAAYEQSAILASDSQGKRIVNAGKYAANFDILSVGMGYHF